MRAVASLFLIVVLAGAALVVNAFFSDRQGPARQAARTAGESASSIEGQAPAAVKRKRSATEKGSEESGSGPGWSDPKPFGGAGATAARPVPSPEPQSRMKVERTSPVQDSAADPARKPAAEPKSARVASGETPSRPFRARVESIKSRKAATSPAPFDGGPARADVALARRARHAARPVLPEATHSAAAEDEEDEEATPRATARPTVTSRRLDAPVRTANRRPRPSEAAPVGAGGAFPAEFRDVLRHYNTRYSMYPGQASGW